MKERRGGYSGKERNASIHKRGMQFVQSTTQIVQFSSGNKAFFKHFFSVIPLELEHNTKYTVIELCKVTHRGLWEAFESTLTILIYSTLKLFLNVFICSRHECMRAHFFNAYKVTNIVEHLHLLNYDIICWSEKKNMSNILTS